LSFTNSFCSRIAKAFRERCSSEEEHLPDFQHPDPAITPLEDKLNNWFESSNRDTAFEETAPDIPDDEETETPEFDMYGDFISKTSAYKWLLASLRRHLLLESKEFNYMNEIRKEILISLLSSERISRKTSAQTFESTFEVDWDPILFVKEQEYNEEPDTAIETAITLTGSARDAQALSCAEYLSQTWSSNGEHLLELVKSVVQHGAGHQRACKLWSEGFHSPVLSPHI